MDLLKSHKRRSRLSDILYIILNLGLAIALLVVVRYVQTPWLAIGLVLLSKWRALAVKPRFWFANLVANMVDIIVGISVVMLMYAANGEWLLQGVLATLYAVWLLAIKPRSNRHMVTVQAGVALFLGVTALSMVSFSLDPVFVVIPLWLIGYSVARHVLGNYDEPLTVIYSLIAAFVCVELGWIAYHWTFGYGAAGMGGIKIPQLAIILTLFGFVAERAYASHHRHGKIRQQDILLPIILAVATLVVLLVFYNRIALNGAL